MDCVLIAFSSSCYKCTSFERTSQERKILIFLIDIYVGTEKGKIVLEEDIHLKKACFSKKSGVQCIQSMLTKKRLLRLARNTLCPVGELNSSIREEKRVKMA